MSERRVGVVNAEIADGWVIGVMFIDDETGIFRASLDNRERNKQIEIKGHGYRCLLLQAVHVIGLNRGLIEVIGYPWWAG